MSFIIQASHYSVVGISLHLLGFLSALSALSALDTGGTTTRRVGVGLKEVDVHSNDSLLALLGVERDDVSLVEDLESSSVDGGDVDEDVSAAIIGADEAESLLGVEPLDGTLGEPAGLDEGLSLSNLGHLDGALGGNLLGGRSDQRGRNRLESVEAGQHGGSETDILQGQSRQLGPNAPF